MGFNPLLTLLACTGSLFFLFNPSQAFYDWTGENSTLDIRGSVQVLGSFSKNPGDELFLSEDTKLIGGIIGRLLIFSDLGEHVGFEFNGFQLFTKGIPQRLGFESSFPSDTERSSSLEWNQQNNKDFQGRMGVDRLNLRFSAGQLDLTLGRQPINLATVFYFTPNDFFASFNPNTFFRIYKPGVDAARAEIQLSPLSQITLISVLGYHPKPSSANGWSLEPYLDRSSFLGRLLMSALGFEWAILGGRIKNQSLVGGSLQGELKGGWGIRAEGHYAGSDSRTTQDLVKAAVDLEYRFQNGLTARLEQYFNSEGYGSNEALNNLILSGSFTGSFSGRHYSTLDFAYEFTPLFSAELLSIINWVDPSFLFSINSIYSLSDEADLVSGFSLPAGERVSGNRLGSEFGAFPLTIFIEARYFF